MDSESRALLVEARRALLTARGIVDDLLASIPKEPRKITLTSQVRAVLAAAGRPLLIGTVARAVTAIRVGDDVDKCWVAVGKTLERLGRTPGSGVVQASRGVYRWIGDGG